MLLSLCLEVWIEAEFSQSGWDTGSGVRRIYFSQNAQGNNWGSGFGTLSRQTPSRQYPESDRQMLDLQSGLRAMQMRREEGSSYRGIHSIPEGAIP